jgi:1-deoxy-D-xylulose-5-phosphate reductoisomerase
MKRISVIGSTGSVGRNTLEVVDYLDGEFAVVGLGVNRSVRTLAEQVARYSPRVVAIADESVVEEFLKDCRSFGAPVPRVLSGRLGLRSLAEMDDVDLVVSAAVGAAGLEPTHAALNAGKRVALANKEAMVIAGELLRNTADRNGGLILPVDSEHNAIDQCLRAGERSEIRRLILTASGGPFLKRPTRDFPTITPEEALNHPTWKMGPRITVDSATLMNKGFEVIEARWLFDVDASLIDVLIHPQSVIHSMVEFVDGSIVAQLGSPDMRGPIQYALTYPHRRPSTVTPLDWSAIARLEFSSPDPEKFPAISMACRALEMGGTAPSVLNAADEVAVDAFLKGRISFTDIQHVIDTVLGAHTPQEANSVSRILEADLWARQHAERAIQRNASTAVPQARHPNQERE